MIGELNQEIDVLKQKNERISRQLDKIMNS
jgi:hypothetical protein